MQIHAMHGHSWEYKWRRLWEIAKLNFQMSVML